MFVLQTAGLKYCEVVLLLWNQNVHGFSFYCRHLGLATKTDQTIFGVDFKLHICFEHLAHEWKYCIIVVWNKYWLIDWLAWYNNNKMGSVIPSTDDRIQLHLSCSALMCLAFTLIMIHDIICLQNQLTSFYWQMIDKLENKYTVY